MYNLFYISLFYKKLKLGILPIKVFRYYENLEKEKLILNPPPIVKIIEPEPESMLSIVDHGPIIIERSSELITDISGEISTIFSLEMKIFLLLGFLYIVFYVHPYIHEKYGSFIDKDYDITYAYRILPHERKPGDHFSLYNRDIKQKNYAEDNYTDLLFLLFDKFDKSNIFDRFWYVGLIVTLFSMFVDYSYDSYDTIKFISDILMNEIEYDIKYFPKKYPYPYHNIPYPIV